MPFWEARRHLSSRQKMEPEKKKPRFFKEANSTFKLPGGYAPNGFLPGVVFFILGIGLGYSFLIPVGALLGLFLAKKIGEDENYIKSVLRHLWVYKGMRFIVASHKVPPSKVRVLTKKGEFTVQEWLQQRKAEEGEHGHQGI